MLGMFNSVKPYVVPKPKVDVPRPDNAVFRLHYKASMRRYFIKSLRRRKHFYNIHEESLGENILYINLSTFTCFDGDAFK